jgi:hypothetical protein
VKKANNMKLTKTMTVLAVGFCLTARAGFYSYIYSGPAVPIPDANLSGWSDSHTFSGLPVQITDVSVKLDISGGYNGDLYAYLSFGNVLLPLLNRVGVGSGNAFGYSDSGMNVTLSDDGAGNIHLYGGGGVPSGTWQPDGRNISPLGAPSSFDAAGTVSFANYQNLNPNGVWTLFIADVSGGGGQSVLNSWELDITAVPEPVNWALAVLAAVFGVGALWRSQWARRRLQRSCP